LKRELIYVGYTGNGVPYGVTGEEVVLKNGK
jgi:hypothetical protein